MEEMKNKEKNNLYPRGILRTTVNKTSTAAPATSTLVNTALSQMENLGNSSTGNMTEKPGCGRQKKEFPVPARTGKIRSRHTESLPYRAWPV